METFTGPGGLILEIDVNDEATPAMVRSPCERWCATYDCAVAIGGLEDAYEISGSQLAWLDKFSEKVEKAYEHARH